MWYFVIPADTDFTCSNMNKITSVGFVVVLFAPLLFIIKANNTYKVVHVKLCKFFLRLTELVTVSMLIFTSFHVIMKL